jgi:hypothetical protein
VFELDHADDDAPAHFFRLLREGKTGAQQHKGKPQGYKKVWSSHSRTPLEMGPGGLRAAFVSDDENPN